MQIAIRILFISFLIMPFYQANAVSSKGMASIVIEDDEASGQELDVALKQAKINSIERYIATKNNSFQRNFDLIRTEIESSVDDYVLGHIILTEKVDSERGRFTLVIRADINTGRLENKLQDMSAVGSATSLEKSYLTFVFVAREQSSIKKYDDKVVKRADAQEQQVGDESETGSNSDFSYSSNSQSSNKTVVGGSVTEKADVVEYSVSSTSDINSVMTRVFTENNFEVIEAEFIEEETNYQLSIENFKSDYSTGNDISGKTLRSATKGIKSVDIPYIAIGSMDIGMDSVDPSTGLTRVFVTVSGKVVSVKKRFPRTIASIGPVQFAGTGPNATVAKTNALKLASEKAAKNLADQLNAKGVK